MPEFVRLGPHDRDAAIIAGIVIGDRRGKGHIQPRRTVNNLIAPIGVDFARQINVHVLLLSA